MPRALTHNERVARKCVSDARQMLGDGWDHVSKDVRWGLVAANILYVYLGQHHKEDPDGSTRAYIQDLTTIANRIVFPEERE
jgi:hypothetical protein